MHQRESALGEQSALLEAQRAELDQQQNRVSSMQQEWDTKMCELETAQEHLAVLKKRLNDELGRLTDQKDDLLPRYGVEDGQSPAEARADAELPKLEDTKARKSLERFQKLCRDAKRKSIGA